MSKATELIEKFKIDGRANAVIPKGMTITRKENKRYVRLLFDAAGKISNIENDKATTNMLEVDGWREKMDDIHELIGEMEFILDSVPVEK